MHTADIHLDSPLRTLALRNPELSDLIGLATRRTFIRIVDLCLEEQVDALLLAGDLYDGEQTSMKTARFLAEQLRRLDEAGIQTFIIRGNHDALSKITSELVMPESVKIFGSQAEAVAVHRGAGQFPVVIHGLSFAKPHAPQSLLRHYPMPVPDAVNIGIMHTSLGGSEGHDRYAPCNLADLHQSGFRYWALGHIHKRSVAEGAASTVVMPGMPQGRDINEDGPKSVSLVTIRDDRSVIVEERCINVAQFERLFIDVSDVADWKAMIGKVSGGLKDCAQRFRQIIWLHEFSFMVLMRWHGEFAGNSISLEPNWKRKVRPAAPFGSTRSTPRASVRKIRKATPEVRFRN